MYNYYKSLIKTNNTSLLALIIFIILFSIIAFLKPNCFYNKNGSLREFGLGTRNKTIFPLWLFSIITGIICYLFVYVLVYNN